MNLLMIGMAIVIISQGLTIRRLNRRYERTVKFLNDYGEASR